VKVYLIGSMRNPKVQEVANWLRDEEFDVFDDWSAVGPEADDYWMLYEKARGRTFVEALKGKAARNVYDFDKRHLDEAAAVVMVAPAGKSAHMELGYTVGRGKPAYILLEGEPERWDIMYQLATGVFTNPKDLLLEMYKLRGGQNEYR